MIDPKSLPGKFLVSRLEVRQLLFLLGGNTKNRGGLNGIIQILINGIKMKINKTKTNVLVCTKKEQRGRRKHILKFLFNNFFINSLFFEQHLYKKKMVFISASCHLISLL